jgi:hypothetical protein
MTESVRRVCLCLFSPVAVPVPVAAPVHVLVPVSVPDLHFPFCACLSVDRSHKPKQLYDNG